ncbi:hypothetical protein TVNIR_1042 [Thioalkalivibrio nitratireducens DSM 14787]|uniref:Uncharacterized protein n=1 Tax=Thioalkalivibrio nitratireducens (strain DSM 14787 / UNIQEM 213 / ALEN2) TaxID=1255043 RepID=L0DUP5_THIND|nr:hypothetical protein TVNIR_1042 [Thioalkalivibrio nitratireducens DSM 14787]
MVLRVQALLPCSFFTVPKPRTRDALPRRRSGSEVGGPFQTFSEASRNPGLAGLPRGDTDHRVRVPPSLACPRSRVGTAG